MSKELDDWRHEQINSRPIAKRKIREHESRLAAAQWKRMERWETPKLFAQGIGIALVVVALGAAIAMGAMFLWPTRPPVTLTPEPAPVDYSYTVVRDKDGNTVWTRKP